MGAERVYLSGTASDQPVEDDGLVTVKVLVFIPAGFEDQEVATVLDVLGWSAYRPSSHKVLVTTCGFGAEKSGAFGTRVHVDIILSNTNVQQLADGHDALVVPGGFHNLGFDEAYCGEVYELIRAFRKQGKPLATLCVGSVLAANAGVLKGGHATTYALSSRHDNPGALRAGGCAQVDESGFVEWSGILSCSGPEYSQEVAERLLELLVGQDASSRIKAQRSGI